MKNKEKKIYVIGHKNPDTDSIALLLLILKLRTGYQTAAIISR